MRRFVVTGAPGSGKTALLGALGRLGRIVGEPARELIAEHRAATGERSLDGRPEIFVSRLIERSIQKFDNGAFNDSVRMYDRGLPDCIVYAWILEVDANEALEAARRHQYSEPVFVLPPWEDIYHLDDMRRMAFEMAEPFHDLLIAAYRMLGYDLVVLPKVTIQKRADMIAEIIDQGRAPS